MGQSLVKQYIHIIFSTKRQEPLILNSIENELFAYIGGICKNLECFPIIIGGYKNHIHVLCLLSKKIALMKLVEEIKSYSSKWIKTKDTRLKNFYWQNGYGAFSVGSSQVEIVKNYIENQHNHHKVKTLQEEYIEFLNSNQIEFDQRYLWD
jgi:putative transposase